MGQVGEFFDEQADAYLAKTGGMTPYHVITAKRIERALNGEVAAIGGLWAEADERRCRDLGVRVMDLSLRMLEHWAAAGFRTVQGDARNTPFEDASFDHVVLPLILHHITEGNWSSARRQVERVIQEMHRVLKPGGTIWISDFSVNRLVYATEWLASGATRRALALARIPLVIMHPARFYEQRLREAGFDTPWVFQPQPPSTSSWDMLTPVIGLDWLRVPRWFYPVEPILICATKPVPAPSPTRTSPSC